MKNKFQVLALSAVALGSLLLDSCKKDSVADEPTPTLPVVVYKPRLATDTSKAYISKIHDYLPAPGQFINEPTGSMENALKLIGTARAALLSLGGYGGSVTFSFDHSIENIEGADLAIYGNPLTGNNSELSEPAIVTVMQDLNNNGIPDDGPWLELAGSEYNKPETIKNYKVTYYNPKNLTDDIRWKDNQGKTGAVLRNNFHRKDYYPLWIANQDSLTLTGTLLNNTLTDGSIITNKPFEWGYADNGSEDYKLLMTSATGAYNSFDLSWAVNAADVPVKLQYIDFVKVYTGQNSNGNPYEPVTNNPRSRFQGEISTEIGGAADIRILKAK
ncbi:PKD domain-containing protein [Mucilaginibacter myungsuensis]|uniref:PKD domain-containing protein n=1 Tax=Mucilaginibacter myungsuensis TaxID=649104 RepID=A0A929KTQ6_9SPHI|nr:PKD domain-containing protein [Mucilaginibacter myungsuensis]MBE9661374.1 PKD domain-containing protein [Mucilaginibacter myungsuensis]MDN3597517.1 PKD domain-containing protein [Mucilaginibacter myungsuensis]